MDNQFHTYNCDIREFMLIKTNNLMLIQNQISNFAYAFNHIISRSLFSEGVY